MPEIADVTAFTLLSGALFSAYIYAGKPLAEDFKWGAYRRVLSGGVSYHFIQRGGLLSDGAVKDIITAHQGGGVRKSGDMKL